MDRKTLFIIAGVLLFVVLVFYGWRWIFSAPPPKSPEELAQIALTASTPQEQEKAAVELAPLGHSAVEPMVRVLSESRTPEVRAVMIQGLAVERDFDSMPAFLNALDDESVLVRTRAAGAVQRLLQIDVGYRADAPREKRLEKIKVFREDWEKMRVTPGLRKFREKLRQQGQ
jgi:hypothetical protein